VCGNCRERTMYARCRSSANRIKKKNVVYKLMRSRDRDASVWRGRFFPAFLSGKLHVRYSFRKCRNFPGGGFFHSPQESLIAAKWDAASENNQGNGGNEAGSRGRVQLLRAHFSLKLQQRAPAGCFNPGERDVIRARESNEPDGESNKTEARCDTGIMEWQRVNHW
jgi:hypothetical protein